MRSILWNAITPALSAQNYVFVEDKKKSNEIYLEKVEMPLNDPPPLETLAPSLLSRNKVRSDLYILVYLDE